MKIYSFSVTIQEDNILKLMVQFIHIMDCVTLKKTALNIEILISGSPAHKSPKETCLRRSELSEILK